MGEFFYGKNIARLSNLAFSDIIKKRENDLGYMHFWCIISLC